MKVSYKIIGTIILMAVISVGCSRKNNTFINRNFHALGTKYNILYNGYIALEKGRETVDNAATDNFWELLPIERMQIEEDIFLPGQSRNQDFERAEEKAIKAVQKHGMNIKGKEYNPQIDEAYLLLGEARYFDQRFIPALEAFNYILYKYPASDKINTAKVWREKTNIRLENNELALKNLKRLLDQEELEDQDLADATAMMAQAYINIKAKDSALTQLVIAAEYTKKNREKARYNFIIGQLYNEFGHKDSANMVFDKIIDMHRKIPRPYYVNAHLAKVENFDLETGDRLAFEEYLTDLEENRENRPYLGRIYYRIAEYHRATKFDSMAIAYYNKSLRVNGGDQQLKAFNYTTLGDMNFDEANYRVAGSYYDSTLTNLKLNSKPYRIIKKKRENLDDVIFYEQIAQVNDSILNLVSLSDEDRLAIFTALTEDLKVKAEEEKEREEAAARKNAGVASATPVNKIGQGRANPKGAGGKQEFYFYNQTTLSFGINEFKRVWGDRELKDNWRLSNTKINKAKDQQSEAGAVSEEDNQLFDPEYYISQIPTDEKVIDSIAKERNYAYYQLGAIYKEKFKEYRLAEDKLEKLLLNQPEDRLVLPSKYNLYKIYVELGENAKAEDMKSNIISNHADSRYAQILLNPESELSKDANSPEAVYEALYAKYSDQEYAEVISEAEVQIGRFEGDPIVPKFEILKASASGRLYGFEAYKTGVNYIALTYPNSEEGKKAENIMSQVIPILAIKEFVDDETSKHFNVLYPFEAGQKEEIAEFTEKLNEAVSKVEYFDLTTSIDVYDTNTTFVVVHGLKSIQGASGFAQILKERKIEIERSFYAISSPNYEIVQRHKNLSEYLASQ